jgi:hypothetical protein
MTGFSRWAVIRAWLPEVAEKLTWFLGKGELPAAKGRLRSMFVYFLWLAALCRRLFVVHLYRYLGAL